MLKFLRGSTGQTINLMHVKYFGLVPYKEGSKSLYAVAAFLNDQLQITVQDKFTDRKDAQTYLDMVLDKLDIEYLDVQYFLNMNDDD